MSTYIASKFPNLSNLGYQVTSPADSRYNCIAWAAGDTRRNWWPAPGYYWPPNCPRQSTLDAFKTAYGKLGYAECSGPELEGEYERIAVFADAQGKPLHAARQNPDGTWTSKLGQCHDIVHNSLYGVEGQEYGKVVLFMKRLR